MASFHVFSILLSLTTSELSLVMAVVRQAPECRADTEVVSEPEPSPSCISLPVSHIDKAARARLNRR